MNKHVESLPKVDMSRTVICDVLRPINVISWKDNTNCIWFFAFQFFLKWTNLRLPVTVQKPSVSALGGFVPWPPDQGLCPWSPLRAPPADPYYRGLTLVFGGLQLSNAGTAWREAFSRSIPPLRFVAKPPVPERPSPTFSCLGRSDESSWWLIDIEHASSRQMAAYHDLLPSAGWKLSRNLRGLRNDAHK